MTLSVTEQLQYATVRIVVRLSNGGQSIGTGFFFTFGEDDLFIVTNKHVLEGGIEATLKLRGRKDNDSPDDLKHIDILINNVQELFMPHPDTTVDLAVLPTTLVLLEAMRQEVQLFFVSLDESIITSSEYDLNRLDAIEDVLMVGYPNGIWDNVNNLPIFRRGITATHPSKNYNGRDEFMIDAACFPGSSGSPIFLCNMGSYSDKRGGIIIGNRTKLLGVLYAGTQHSIIGEIEIVPAPTHNIPIAVSQIPNNLGICVKARRILDFQKVIRKAKE